MTQYYSEKSRKMYNLGDLPKTLKPYFNYRFGAKANDFGGFSNKFRNALVKELLPEGYSLAEFNKGFYYFSGMIENEDGNLIYFSIGDARWEDWASNILIRTAKSLNDYVGGRNHYTDIFNFTHDITTLY